MTYFVFRSASAWRGRYIHAEITNEPFPEVHPHWWRAEPIMTPLPLLQFITKPKAPLFDNHFTGTEFELYSDKLIHLLHQAGIRFETFPAEILNSHTKELISSQYRVFHLLEIYPALDEARSIWSDWEKQLLVTYEEKLKHHPLLFRMMEIPYLVLIHQDLKNVLDAEGVTGCTYTPIETYRSGLL